MIAEPAQVDIDAGERQPPGEARRDAFRPSLACVLFYDLLDPVALGPPFDEHREVDLAGGDGTRLPVDSIDPAVPDQQILPVALAVDDGRLRQQYGRSDLGESLAYRS